MKEPDAAFRAAGIARAKATRNKPYILRNRARRHLARPSGRASISPPADAWDSLKKTCGFHEVSAEAVC